MKTYTADEVDEMIGRALAREREQRKPLTDEEITQIAATPAAIPGSYVFSFARAIEAAHGIKGDA